MGPMNAFGARAHLPRPRKTCNLSLPPPSARSSWTVAEALTSIFSPRIKKPRASSGFFVARGCLHHAAHATHTAHATHIRHCRSLVVSALSNHGFGGNHQTADGGRSLQRGTGHLGRVENTHLDHVAIGIGRSVEAEVAFALLDLVDHYARL